MIRHAVLSAVLISTATAVSAQDLTVVFKSTDGGAATHYFTKDRIRMNNGRTDAMIEFSTGRMVNIDHQKKEYSEITIAELEAAMKAASAQMEESMAKVPPQVREQMAKMMGGAAADVTVTKGATRTIAGYPCQDYTIAMGANMTMESCNSTALVPPFDPANFVKLQRLTIPMIQGADKMIAKMQEVKGIALENHSRINIAGQKRETGMEATEVKKGPVPASVFDVPADYKKVESPMKAMGKGRR